MLNLQKNAPRSRAATALTCLALSTTATVPAFAADEARLEEVIVTASKRETKLMETPLAITAFTQDFLEQLDVSAQWPLSRRLSGVARWNYSLQDNSLLEALVGLEYTAGCWAMRLVGHRFVTSVDQESTSLLFQLELNGLSRIGNNPLELLRQNIGGYSREYDRTVPLGPAYPGMETE